MPRLQPNPFFDTEVVHAFHVALSDQRDRQAAFQAQLGLLIHYVETQPLLRLRLGDGYMAPGIGERSALSLHRERLAQDLILDKFDRDHSVWVWQERTESYEPIGRWWMRSHPLAQWGGMGGRGDGNHFSFQWQGRW